MIAWLRRGLRWTPWIHGVATFLVGALLYVGLQQAIVFLFLFGPLWIIAIVAAFAIAFLAFGWLGSAMTNRRSGWWLGLSAAPWLVIGVIVFVAAQTPHGWDPSVLWPYALAGLAPAAIAFLTHAGPPRAIALVCIVAAIALGIQAKSQSDVVSAQQRLGSTLRPEVTSVAGYVPFGETQLESPGTTSQALAWGYIKSEVSTDGYPIQFVLTTDQKRVDVCGPTLDAHQTAPEPQSSCTRAGDEWVRTSAGAHELSRVVDGKLVRATAPLSTPTAVLRAALNNAKPMDDRYYRHLLFGESGQYIPELDGLR